MGRSHVLRSGDLRGHVRSPAPSPGAQQRLPRGGDDQAAKDLKNRYRKLRRMSQKHPPPNPAAKKKKKLGLSMNWRLDAGSRQQVDSLGVEQGNVRR